VLRSRRAPLEAARVLDPREAALDLERSRRKIRS
jgi:hypothetical protein